MLGDASTHACFAVGPYRLEGIRFFAGVPLLSPEGIAIGVVCVFDPGPRETIAEDLLILEEFGRQGSLLFRLLSLGRPAAELPGRMGAGMVLRPSFALLVDAELRLLRRFGGSMELAVMEMDDPAPLREGVMQARSRERTAAGALGAKRFAVYKRHPGGEARAELGPLLSDLGASAVDAIGSVSVGGDRLPAINGNDLLHLAELALEQVLCSGGTGVYRLVLQHDVSEMSSAAHP